jgi:hypothetical protein
MAFDPEHVPHCNRSRLCPPAIMHLLSSIEELCCQATPAHFRVRLNFELAGKVDRSKISHSGMESGIWTGASRIRLFFRCFIKAGGYQTGFAS